MSKHATRARWRQVVATLVVIVLAAATLYEAALALGAISIGDGPGEDAPGRDAVVMAGALSLLGGLVVALASVGVPETITRTVRQLLPLAGASLIVAHGYAFDPYFALAPTLLGRRRFTGLAAPLGRGRCGCGGRGVER